MLTVENLHASVQGKPILKGLSLTVPKGEIHVIMGPNGAGKSTLGHVLMGSPGYEVTQGSMHLGDTDLALLKTNQRALEGLFLGFQYPVAIPGLKLSEYLRNLYSLKHKAPISVSEFRKLIKEKLAVLQLDRYSLQRDLNDGFSGGEMKRFELLQLMILEPKIAILDEIDSGVDLDAQKIIANAILFMKEQLHTSFLIVTHYPRLIQLLQPNKIHLIIEGRIERSGGADLVSSLETEGYHWLKKETSK